MRFETPKGSRYRCSSIKVDNDLWRHRVPVFDRLITINPNLAYVAEEKLWKPKSEIPGCIPGLECNSVPIHSVRAAKRHIRKHDELPKGTELKLFSRLVGASVYFKK